MGMSDNLNKQIHVRTTEAEKKAFFDACKRSNKKPSEILRLAAANYVKYVDRKQSQ